ncbi:MAG: hypothetical protein IH606_00665 [Burkholderiales bacterium]|nr:hypothetical protein [Burkholderiales bacterium]
MAKFVPGQAVVTELPSVVVDAGLPPGRHRFQLAVVTDSGRTSSPDIAVVQVDALIATADPLRPVLSPEILSTPTPVLPPHTIATTAAVSGTAPTVPTAPKTVSPSAVSGAAASRKTRKKKG